MTTKLNKSTKLISIVILLTFTLILPGTLANSGGIPTGYYSITIAAADVPPEFPPEVAAILVGTWTIAFTEDGESYVTKDGDRVVEGSYRSSKEHLVMRDVSGPLACTDDHGIATGVYTWSLDNNELTLKPVLDRCFGRAFILTLRPMQQL